MPVRSALQERKAREASAQRAIAADLAAHRRVERTAEDPVTLGERLAKRHSTYVFRKPSTFNRRIRSKDGGKIRLAAAEHVFGRYPAPRHLRSVWTEEPRVNASAAEAEIDTFRREVYLTCVSGGSVHKRCTGAFMTKAETHRFLGLGHIESFTEAIWFSLALSFTTDRGIARRLSVSRIADESHESAFWREVLRFFCANPVPIAQVNDLIDFLRHWRRDHPDYSLRGRTLHSLCEQEEQWRRALARARRMGDAKWPGVDLKDAEFRYEPASKDRRFDWRFNQIKTSQDLADEGTRMHHCVYSYQQKCIAGGTSIWSLKVRPASRNDQASYTRALTIELANHQKQVVQIRGYANRAMTGDERAIVSKWAATNGLSLSRFA
jgi:hypothetical protein